MNYRDILLKRSLDPFEELLEDTYGLLCKSEVDENFLEGETFEDLEISEEERKEIIDYIESLELALENRELFEEYEEIELLELGLKNNGSF